MTWCRYDCRRCGAHFTSLEGFDAHHSAEPCSFPEDADLVETAGNCRIGDPTRVVKGTIYSTVRASRAANYFRPTNGAQTAPANVKRASVGAANE
jgi:hypothetical protein